MSPPLEWMCGQQRLWMEGPDLLCMELHGTFDAAGAEAYLRLVFELGDRHGTFALLADMRDLQSIPPHARSRLSRVDRTYPYRAVALHGASFTLGIVATMVVKAGRTLAPSAFPFELAFFQTEAQARAFLAPFRDRPPQGRRE
ncbi:STAS/SEC14 domain-containing protein [Polyangium sp. 6x1]|uniref:STAS/SEC14 domain-containing protein n=1 Tax=Polyangium sp. 6x1 TaxID=3042689 RepID=UPI002482DC79|nr:STAS/SEC14 domain-containing protein [Polyangium sp. 6x1]MDI1451061.1 STAS/SEC14 domain-containing protein [Polyangium sp. 6x1]